MSSERGTILRRRRSQGDDGGDDGGAQTPAPEPKAAPAPTPREGTREATPRQAPRDERPAAARPAGRQVAPGNVPASRESSHRGGRAPIVGRRAYDPRADRSPGPQPAPSGALPGSTARKAKKFGGRASVSEEKLALREKAQNLSKEKNIPLIHAYRILKGQTTLNEVLKAMMRKERFEQMITRDGIDRELAGQVASGHLSKQRAVLLTRMRTLRKQKLHIDGIKAAEIEKVKVGLDIFGRGWVAGRVRNVRPYEFDFFAEEAERSERFFKHDVKAMCVADELDVVRASVGVDEAVQREGLGATDDRAARIRPDDESLLTAIEKSRVVRFTMRDGETILGKIRSFGRWDAEVCLEGGELVTVFFHGLHPVSKTLGYGGS
jgi:hypothetical protein